MKGRKLDHEGCWKWCAGRILFHGDGEELEEEEG